MPRQANKIYTSPWGDHAKVEPGSAWDYVCGYPTHSDCLEDKHPKLALHDLVTDEKWSYGDMRDWSTCIAAALLNGKLGLKPGDRVLLSHPSGPIFLILLFACLRAQLIPGLANPAYTPKEFLHGFKTIEAKAVLRPKALAEAFTEAGISDDISVDTTWPPNERSKAQVWDLARGDVATANRILADKGADRPVDWKKTAGIFFSSGTTGLPKAVCISHSNLLNEFKSYEHVPDFDTDPYQPHYVALPLFHVAGLLSWLFAGIMGRPVLFSYKQPLDPQLLMKHFDQSGAVQMMVVPPLLLGITKMKLMTDKTHPHVRFLIAGAAPLGPDLHKESMALFGGKPIIQVWGMSETTGAATKASPVEEIVVGSCGKIMPSVEMRIVDEEEKDVEDGQAGEVWIRGEINMVGYLNNPEATREMITEDGWLKTGDIGYVGPDGDSLHLVDRKKELIKFRGYQVAPAELEDLIQGHPDIADVGVVGVKDSNGTDELPRAYCVLGPNAKDKKKEDLAKEIVSFVKSKVSSQKQLRGGVVFIDAIPKNPSGKVRGLKQYRHAHELTSLSSRQILRKDLRALSANDQAKPKEKL